MGFNNHLLAFKLYFKYADCSKQVFHFNLGKFGLLLIHGILYFYINK